MGISKYTILIGSYARGDANSLSDVDILRIGNNAPFSGLRSIPINAHISYIDYDISDFMCLHYQGSLFLYHVYTEGVLLQGCSDHWKKLKQSFKVAKSHKASTMEYINLLSFINSYPDYEKAYIPYLSNTFKALKNIGIFALAERKQYRFDKMSALIDGCGLTEQFSVDLRRTNNCFERNIPITDKEHPHLKEVAIDWKSQCNSFMGSILNDF